MKTMPEIRIDAGRSLSDEPTTGHNRWHPDIPPVIRCDPGEEVVLETRDAFDGHHSRPTPSAVSPSTSRSASSSTCRTCSSPPSCPKTSSSETESSPMDYLVTMTTHVPDGTPDTEVEDVRRREAARSRQLAAQGNLLRLWRPPLQPGEWRTLGLFAADDGDAVELVLRSMPLRVWRTDGVVALGPHPNDPARSSPGTDPEVVEFLTAFTIAIPPGTPAAAVDDTLAREAQRVRELAERDELLRLWALSAEDGRPRALGLWRARSQAELQGLLESLPLNPWMSVETTPLSPHPNDPATSAPAQPAAPTTSTH
jgi:muconolactone delta-isomerase